MASRAEIFIVQQREQKLMYVAKISVEFFIAEKSRIIFMKHSRIWLNSILVLRVLIIGPKFERTLNEHLFEKAQQIRFKSCDIISKSKRSILTRMIMLLLSCCYC